MLFGLDIETINSINSQFKKHSEIESVKIYGSRAKGNYRNGSDIDLVLYGDKCTIKTLFQVEEELEELFLPYKFDISIFSDIDNQELLDHVNRVGKDFYIIE